MSNKIEKALFEKWLEWDPINNSSTYVIKINEDEPTVSLIAKDYPHFKMNFVDDHYLDIRSIEVLPGEFGRVDIYLVYAVPEEHIEEWKAYIEHKRSKNKRNKSNLSKGF